MQIQQYIDHTLLSPTATLNDIRKLCEEADQYHFFSVCVHSSFVSFAAKHLADSDSKVCAVVGFPLGTMSSEAKAFEARKCIEDGANEVDMVIHLGMLKAQQYDYVKKDIEMVKKAVGDHVLKVILETGNLSDQEITIATQLAVQAKADFVKTSTGFGPRGASLDDIALMKAAISDDTKIKASGGIRDLRTAKAYIEAGATRIGTSSGIAIASGGNAKEGLY